MSDYTTDPAAGLDTFASETEDAENTPGLAERYAEYEVAAAERRASQALARDVPLNSGAQGVDSLVVFSGKARCLGFGVDNTAATACYIQIFDANAVPADTAVPLRSWSVAGGASLDVAFETHGRWFHRGLVIVSSSTPATKTITSAAALLIDVQRM